MKTLRGKLFAGSRVLIALLLMLQSGLGSAAQQYEGICAAVKMNILQEMTLERMGFLATLQITNNESDASITDFSARLLFVSQDETEDNASELFFVQPPELEGINAVDGTGVIAPGQTATIRWFIIPKTAAGGTEPNGLRYAVGAELAASIYGQQVAPAVLDVRPDVITVLPEAQLEITYFQPRDVIGDDPFTPDVVESPIPFTLGVMVRNAGYGVGSNVRVDSQHPKIEETSNGALLVAQLLGSRIDDEPTDHSSLTLNLGNIPPGRCRKGAWDMLTTLSGEFVEFKASYSHNAELGGRDTSLIKSLDAHFINHEVLNDQPGRDDLLDFLADTLDDADREIIPDTLYESDCNTLPVNRAADVEVLSYDPGTLTAQVRSDAQFENWVFIRVDDPAQAKLPIASVVRSDGKVLDEHNYWTHIRYTKPDNRKLTWLNIFDFVALGEYTYEVTYAPPGSDGDPPETVLRFFGEVQERDGKYYVTRDTQLYFTVEDASPVGTFYKLETDLDYRPALPFRLSVPGEHTVSYFSEDASSNTETPRQATVVLSDAYPQVAGLGSDTTNLFIAGDALSVRPTAVNVAFQGVMTASRLDGEADVFAGVYGYPTLAGLPASPTAATAANLTVGGEQVDYYRYRTNGGSWSGEAAVSEPLVLGGLSGAVSLEVQGRSQYGDYPAESEVLTANWQVDGGTALEIEGIPATPGRLDGATLAVTGSADYCYRVDEDFYRPNLASGEPIQVSGLEMGDHQVEVIARGSGGACPGDVAGEVTASWRIDHHYGYQLPADEQVRHEALGQVDDLASAFVWDGRDDAGVVVAPGWYSVRVTLSDGLGRSAYGIQPVAVGDMLSDGTRLADGSGASQQHARAFGRWVAWQDQRSGDWDIWVQDLLDPGAAALAISRPLNQERPSTDGRWAVWQDRQADGTWDIWAKQLGRADAPFAVTMTPGVDEHKPVIDWPWVAYQRRSASDPSAPWQLYVYNLETATESPVDASTQDQLDPAIHRGRLVWQDWRDVGPGEIYLKDLRTDALMRLTDDPGGQYHPAIFDHWVVWSDNRQGLQLDLYGYNLRRGAEVQLTATAEDENRPSLNGAWVVYEEDAGGESAINLRLLHLGNGAAVQLTNAPSVKEQPVQASDRLIWVDQVSGHREVMVGALPDLQPVFANRNTVAVTQGMADYQGDAHSLLSLWNAQTGVTGITRYTSLLPTLETQTANWNGGVPGGDNFPLEPGSFLWVRFEDTRILELGEGACGALDLVAGANLFSYACFPDHYTAYGLIRELGESQVVALRVLDAETGRWRVANVSSGVIVGEDFRIPTIAVVMLDVAAEQAGWTPGGP